VKRTDDAELDTDTDVPEIIYALAEVFHDHGICTSTAVRMAAEMLAEAMDAPDLYLDQITFH
jgi:hypothetical protein